MYHANSARHHCNVNDVIVDTADISNFTSPRCSPIVRKRGHNLNQKATELNQNYWSVWLNIHCSLHLLRITLFESILLANLSFRITKARSR
uniref:Uncharacterized protein n=1 Tax=Anguilla anguilla TaxID=7936 RepID=A0A0E9WYL7_ANGAN